MNEYSPTEIPDWLKWMMIFIDRIGFSVLAFLLMFYLCQVTINKNTEALRDVMAMMRAHDVVFAHIQEEIDRRHVR